jgi:hypothetical protein
VADGAGNVVTEFMRHVVANDVEEGFGLIDISSLVNYGKEQGEWYRSLTRKDQEFYRRTFIEGIYTYFFRNLPADQAAYTLSTPDPVEPVVEVAGRHGKVLRFTLRRAGSGWRIFKIDKI